MKNRDDMLALGVGLALIGDLIILATISQRRERVNNNLFIPKTTVQAIAKHAARKTVTEDADTENT